MNDLTITTTSHIQARWIQSVLDEVVTWAHMKFKTKKSRCMIIKKGKVGQQFKLKVQGEEIPSIGKWYDDSLRDQKNIEKINKQVVDWLKKLEKFGLPGKYKVWLYQHGMFSRLMWTLMLYEISLTTVESLERSINRNRRKWLGVPPSFTAVGLYSRTTELQLPISSVVEEFKASKCRLIMTI